MNNLRAKLMAGATVLGLGALGGIAMGTNQGLPTARQLAASGSGIVTGASGAVATQPASATASTRPPIVTRASGGGVPVEIDD